jgi:hypothetical protein
MNANKVRSDTLQSARPLKRVPEKSLEKERKSFVPYQEAICKAVIANPVRYPWLTEWAELWRKNHPLAAPLAKSVYRWIAESLDLSQVAVPLEQSSLRLAGLSASRQKSAGAEAWPVPSRASWAYR